MTSNAAVAYKFLGGFVLSSFTGEKYKMVRDKIQ